MLQHISNQVMEEDAKQKLKVNEVDKTNSYTRTLGFHKQTQKVEALSAT